MNKRQIVDIPEPTPILRKASYPFSMGTKKLNTIYDLVDHLEQMDDESYASYTEPKNHFASWIEKTFKETTLADELRVTQNKEEFQRKLLKHLVRTLAKMNDDTYQSYLDTPYAHWIKVNIGDKETAKKLSKTANKEQAVRIVEKKLAELLRAKTVVKTKNYTPLAVTHRKNIKYSQHVTRLPLGQIFVHETNQGHHAAIELASFVAFGIVAGAAFTILLLMVT